MNRNVALITGAASGIGQATAERFAADGFAVLVADVDQPAATKVADAIVAAGGVAQPCPFDVSQRAGWELAVGQVHALGTLAVLVNNAGIVRDKTLVKMTDEQWDAVIAVHLRGAFLGCQFALREMRTAGGGRIVNVSSVAYQGSFGQANYSAAKAGVIGLTKTVALEGARHGVLANVVAPTTVDTPMFRALAPDQQRKWEDEAVLGRVAQPSELAAVIRFLSSDDASYVTGQVIDV